MSVYVGIDVHRKRSQVTIANHDGTIQVNRNVPNDRDTLLDMIGNLPAGTPVAFQAAYGWGWLVQLVAEAGSAPHLVHPLQAKAIASARLTNDRGDAAILAQLLRADLLPEAWITPAPVRQQRALVRPRAQLVRLRTLATGSMPSWPTTAASVRPGCWNSPGRAWLAPVPLPTVACAVVEDLLALIDAVQRPIDRLDAQLLAQATANPHVKVLTQLPGSGP